MKATWMLVAAFAVGCGGGAKAVAGDPGTKGAERADIGAVSSSLSVYTDGKGHYFPLVEPDWQKESSPDLTLFYGDGKTFHAAKVARAHADGMKFEIGFQDPRIPASPAGTITRELGKVTLSCYGTEVELTKVPPADAQAMLAGATFYKNGTRFSPLALARKGDEYLYVDRELGDDDAKEPRYRVFSGKKGDMHAIDVQSGKYIEGDNAFKFVTGKGTLIASRDENAKEYAFGLAWEGKKETWDTLGRAESWRLIFEQLGIYRGRTPTPCDPMMP